jgi:hypothetical protein
MCTPVQVVVWGLRSFAICFTAYFVSRLLTFRYSTVQIWGVAACDLSNALKFAEIKFAKRDLQVSHDTWCQTWQVIRTPSDCEVRITPESRDVLVLCIYLHFFVCFRRWVWATRHPGGLVAVGKSRHPLEAYPTRLCSAVVFNRLLSSCVLPFLRSRPTDVRICLCTECGIGSVLFTRG